MNIFGVSSLSPFGNSASKSGNENGSRESFADLLSKMSEAKQPASVAPSSSAAEGDSPDVENAYHEKLQVLRERVEEIMSQLNIDTAGDPLTVHLNASGEVVVSGEHPQKAGLQKAIANNPGLQELFAQVAHLAEKLAMSQNPNGIETILNSKDSESMGSINFPERFSLRIDGTTTEPQIG